jgi:hypothetical protein
LNDNVSPLRAVTGPAMGAVPSDGLRTRTRAPGRSVGRGDVETESAGNPPSPAWIGTGEPSVALPAAPSFERMEAPGIPGYAAAVRSLGEAHP